MKKARTNSKLPLQAQVEIQEQTEAAKGLPKMNKENDVANADDVSDAAQTEETNSDFEVTRQLEVLNDKLKDGIYGVLKRASSVFESIFCWVFKLIFKWIPRLVKNLFVSFYRTIAAICRKIWAIVSFIFSAKFLRLLKQNFLLIVLTVILIVLIVWPFMVPVMYDVSDFIISDPVIWNIFGAIWALTIGIVGAVRGIRNGSWKRLVGKVKNKLKERKERRLARKEAKRLAKEEAQQAKQRAKEEAKSAAQQDK